MEYTMVTSAYSNNMEYIGDEDFAKRLQKMDVEPELANSDNKVCSIGFCEKGQKWYGWSHRAMYGFGIGSKVKKGDCGYVAKNKFDFLQSMIRFWQDDSHLNVTGEHSKEEIMEYVPIDVGEAEQKPIPTGKFESGVQINWTYKDDIPNEKLRSTISGSFQPYPDSYGKGEWKAESLEDAKQMAIDFADGVS